MSALQELTEAFGNSPAAQPRITVIMPVFNQAAYVEAALGSVLDQNYPNLEFLVFDGASTDGSEAIIRRYADRLAWYESTPDRGQVHAINKGLERATGDWIAYLNSDDLYLPGALQAVAEAAVPGVYWLTGGLRYISAAGRPVGERFPEVEDLSAGAWIDYRTACPQPATFFHRHLLERTGPFDETLRLVFDTEFWMRAAREGFTPGVVHRPLAAFRLHDASKTGQGRIPFLEEQKTLILRFSASLQPGEDRRLRDRLDHRIAMEQVYRVAGVQGRSNRLLRLAGLAAQRPSLLTERPWWGAVKQTIRP